MKSLLKGLCQRVEGAASQYARLMLIVGQHGTGKSRLLREFASTAGYPFLDLGADLPPSPFEVPARRRPVAASDRVGEALRTAGGIATEDSIEMRFQPHFNLDPPKLPPDNTRFRTIIAGREVAQPKSKSANPPPGNHTANHPAPTKQRYLAGERLTAMRAPLRVRCRLTAASNTVRHPRVEAAAVPPEAAVHDLGATRATL